MPLFKNTIRSAHGMFSQKRVSDASRSSASTTTSSAQKGSSSELAPAYVDSVMAPDADAQAKADGSGGAINEPLVLDFPTMLDGADPNTNGAPLSPVISLVDLERRTSWLSDDDDSAPAPRIEFARREIHIPSRTSSTTPQAIQHRVELQRRLSQEPTSPLAPTTPERLRSRAHSYSRTSITSPNRSLSSRNPQTPGRSHTPIPQSITPQRSHTSNSYFATPDRSYTSNPYIGTPRRSQAPIPETSPQKRSQTPIPQTSPQKRSQTPILQGSPPKRSQTPILQGSPQKRSQTPILQGSPQKRSQTPVPQTSPQKRSQTPNPQTPAAVETEQPTMRSSADSVISYQSTAPSVATNRLGPLQQKGGTLEEGDRLSPLLEDDPNSFDLVCAPMENGSAQFSLEDRSEQLFSKEHLQAIFADTSSLLRFTSFLSTYRPNSVPTLVYYLDALKALRAINYANAVAEALEPINNLGFTETPVRATVNANLEEKANQAFDVLVRDDLPAFITHVFVQVASVSISKRVTGNLPPMLREASEGLAEVFCLTDPSRTDNPIIFASEEFHRTTQYGVGYAIGRNCRFLQGPRTNRNSVARFKKAIQEGRDHNEVFLNYRRDGSPFMNLLMVAPLLDSRGTLRYHIGAQIDVTGLARDATDLEAFQRMIHQDQDATDQEQSKEEFKALCEMFNHTELETVRRYGGNMHREHLEEKDEASMNHKPRVLIQDQSTFDVIQAEKQSAAADGRLSGPYKHYLIVRPAPSLRILFTSPSLRVPGILQSRFLDRIGGSNRVRDSLGDALADGSRGVTAKIRWLTHPVADLEDATDEGRPRWIHCTPLLGQNGAVGVWMVVLVDEKDHAQANRRFRQAPPIPNDIRGHSLASSPFPRTNTRLSDYSEENNSSYPSRTASPYANSYNNGYGISNGISNGYGSGNGYGNGNGNGVGRISAMENLRRPVTPRRGQSPMYDQRTPNSGTSSVKDFANGNTSVDSFRI